MKLSLVLCGVVLCAFVSSGLSRPFDPEEAIEDAEIQLILSRMRRHQADSLFTHYRRRNTINLKRQWYLRKLINSMNKRDSEPGSRFARSAELPQMAEDEVEQPSLADLKAIEDIISSSPELYLDIVD